MPAQSKCTWTFHKNHFVWKFTGKMPDATDTTSIKHGALTIAVRTPQCGHTVWGIAGNMQETLDYKSPSIQVNSSNFWLAQDITNHNFKMPAFLGSAPQNFSPESKATGLQVWDKLDMCVLERACWCHCRVQGTVRVPCALWTAVGVLCVPAGGRYKVPLQGACVRVLCALEARCSPQTRMLTRMLMVRMSKHTAIQSRRTLLWRSLLNSLVHSSPVARPVRRRMWNMEEGGVQSVECGV